MSKIGRLNLELQEQANELGFSTTQEALDNGYTITAVPTGAKKDFRLEPVKFDSNSESIKWLRFGNEYATLAEAEAHEAWLKEKEILIHEVEMLINDTPYQVYKDALRKVVKFLEGVKHE